MKYEQLECRTLVNQSSTFLCLHILKRPTTYVFANAYSNGGFVWTPIFLHRLVGSSLHRDVVFHSHIYLNAKVSQPLLKCYFLLFEPNILLHYIVINKSNDLPSKQHENQTSETYDCRSSTRNVRQPKFEKSQSYNTLHFIESQCYTTWHFIRKRF